jgi:hypothetical protein
MHGRYKLTKVQPEVYNGSVKGLKNEVEHLLSLNPPQWAEDILLQMLQGVDLAINTKQEITLDDNAFTGD